MKAPDMVCKSPDEVIISLEDEFQRIKPSRVCEQEKGVPSVPC